MSAPVKAAQMAFKPGQLGSLKLEWRTVDAGLRNKSDSMAFLTGGEKASLIRAPIMDDIAYIGRRNTLPS